MYDALIISDLHLGSNVCQAKQINSFLKKIETGELSTKELILNGDVFDSWDFRRIKKQQWKVLSNLRSLSDNVKITWINGNHDGPAEIISHLLGISVTEEYFLVSGDRNILVLHGHVFDEFISDHPIITWVADTIYHLIQRIDRNFYWARSIKKASKTFLRCSELIQIRALDYAEKYKANVVCCGHTHLEVAYIEEEVKYYNSGCWTELPCHYLTIRDGIVNVEKYLDSNKEET
jgi:UDP-2,3-diacylglucosamine pyrophosphatase LpxH